MSKRKHGAKRSRARWAGGGMDTRWYKPPPLRINSLSGGTANANHGILNGSDLMPATEGSLDLERSDRSVTILRVILKITAIVAGSLAQELVKYFWGIRVQELDAAGSLSGSSLIPPDSSSIQARKEDWWYRKNAECLSGATGAVQVMIGGGADGDPVDMRADWKPNRRLKQRQLLLFVHGWQLFGGSPPDKTFDGELNYQILVGFRGGT